MASNRTPPIPQDKIGESFVWRDWFQKLSDKVFGSAATIDVPILPQYGGTGQTTYTDGQIMIGNSLNNGLSKSLLTAGTNITITNGHGSITISSTGGGGGGGGGAGGGGFGMDGEDGMDAFPIPGAQGPQGNAGPAGPQGAMGLGIDGSDGEDGMPIPGPRGIQGVAGPTGAGGAQGYWGYFWDTTTQTTTANTATAVNINSTDPNSSGVGITSGNRITFAYAGVYTVTYSLQVTSSDTSIHDVNVWWRLNDSGSAGDVVASNSFFSVESKHGSVNGNLIAVTPFTLKVNAGDFLQLMWSVDSPNISLASLAAGTTPVYPTTPSVIVSVQQVLYTQVGPMGPQGWDGEQGEDGPMGPPGIQGPQGTAGPQGPLGPAVYLEADYQEADLFVVPGQQGPVGPTGAAGPAGTNAAYMTAGSVDDLDVENVAMSMRGGVSTTTTSSGTTNPTGAGTDLVFNVNTKVVTTSYSLSSTQNALSVGPITINTGITVTIPSGSRWVIL